MSLAVTYTRAMIGVQAPDVYIEVHISSGLPALTLVGLPETTVKEARDRVRSALINCGFTFPAKRITVNLAPADLPKEGGRYDLPIALAILAASEQIDGEKLSRYEFLGELGLSGTLRGVNGAIPAALEAIKAGRQLILPDDNKREMTLIPQGEALMAGHLLDVCAFLSGEEQLLSCSDITPVPPIEEDTLDLKDIIGQEQAKRALEIAAAGGHNLLLLGPPGTGKTMLASRLGNLMPPLSDEEALESAAINSLINIDATMTRWRARPFRAPHHSSSMAALVGGGSLPKPGEISLAHNGVLFLDELPEFERRVLDSLREPLESGEIIISRTRAKVCYPARVQLVAAMNPSPSGHYQGVHNRLPAQQILRYLSKLSGPFLDRFDLSIEVPLLPPGVLSQQHYQGESSATIRERVLIARQIQLKRANKINALLTSREIEKYCGLEMADATYLEEVMNKLGLSVRAWHRILKVARTIADLGGRDNIERKHLAEALSYRCMDRLLIQLHKNLE
ncbi:YifB family Mg chelatase-like AAA ATPase [Pectobacterium brasiliense]|uniref:YifB family Mg chelatase-like AAA ATPase n=1 Tax=Pectobacterium brasiliense TaxID=180957 RepID=UPI001CE1EB1D|nr:YifB family Mg chelatase-like AAA ATPase [Pectobacterium brasiliense]MCA5920933.1 YifB family Mg chelatase-like AAA ATPase [Pectobacterium brasiliense]MCA5927053.1 YifB family Mg chelatase-like AAA ATPase [Pectobacterium brasiliense]MCA5937152.1 YifB family Mg chelatase-like AAA ATPase [Pectobacterium brasiliense]MCA5941060.1 YifB family Mg chelatase-like AAA ATPase [Pectobacterium brasiliense]MCA5943859.1 YifB family Mg chelatase-like AAA ATPase [Pectobacterium brasiliense]